MHTKLGHRTTNVHWLLLLLNLSCVISPENGATFAGTNVNRSMNFEGIAQTNGTTISIQMLDPANADPDNPASTWVQVGSAISGPNPLPLGGQVGYGWSSTFNVNSGPSSRRWRNGGLARFRVVDTLGTAGGGGPLVTFDDDGCWEAGFDAGQPYTVIANNCKSHDTPILTLVDVDPIPAGDRPYLSRDITYETSSDNYYQNIDAPPDLDTWLTENGFPSDEVVTRYYNKGDLGLGREMHCRSENIGFARVACYVVNYGSVYDGLVDQATMLADLDDDGAFHNPFATVAMSWIPGGTQPVRFYVYNFEGKLSNRAELDSQGPKYVPGACLNCHGGTFDDFFDSVSGGRFLPFDLNSFAYSKRKGLTRANQEEAFRKLNELVLIPPTDPSITALINGWYGGAAGVHTEGTTQNSAWIPAGYATEKIVYQKAVAPYCRTCHVASSVKLDTFVQLQAVSGAALNDVCVLKEMPHAETTRNAFWRSSARAHLAGALNWSTDCN